MHVFDYRFLAKDVPADLAGASNVLFDLRARNDLRMSERPQTYEELR